MLCVCVLCTIYFLLIPYLRPSQQPYFISTWLGSATSLLRKSGGSPPSFLLFFVISNFPAFSRWSDEVFKTWDRHVVDETFVRRKICSVVHTRTWKNWLLELKIKFPLFHCFILFSPICRWKAHIIIIHFAFYHLNGLRQLWLYFPINQRQFSYKTSNIFLLRYYVFLCANTAWFGFFFK